ncbi:MAG: hypothetical protein R3Y53_03495 [Bacillota bacterium]
MKKLVFKKNAVAMGIVMAMSLTACGGTAPENTASETAQTTQESENTSEEATKNGDVNTEELYQEAMMNLENYDSLVGRNVMYYTTTMLDQVMEEVILREFQIVNAPVKMQIDTTTIMDGNVFEETAYYEGEGETVNVYYDGYAENWYLQEVDITEFTTYQLSMLQKDVLTKAENIIYYAETENEAGITQYELEAEISWATILDMAESNGILVTASMMDITKDDLLEILQDKENMKIQLVIDENGFLQSAILEMKSLMEEIMMAISGGEGEVLATFDRAEIHIIINEYDTISDIEISEEMKATAETIE